MLATREILMLRLITSIRPVVLSNWAIKSGRTMAQGRFAVVEGCPDARAIDLDLDSLKGSLFIGPNVPLQAHGKICSLYQ